MNTAKYCQNTPGMEKPLIKPAISGSDYSYDSDDTSLRSSL